MHDERERLELKIAYLESAYQVLSDMVYRQQRDIEQLRALLAAAQGQIEALRAAAPTSRGAEDERPPHY